MITKQIRQLHEKKKLNVIEIQFISIVPFLIDSSTDSCIPCCYPFSTACRWKLKTTIFLPSASIKRFPTTVNGKMSVECQLIFHNFKSWEISLNDSFYVNEGEVDGFSAFVSNARAPLWKSKCLIKIIVIYFEGFFRFGKSL